MNKKQFQEALHELAAEAVSSDLDLWPSIRERLARRSHSILLRRLIPSTRLGWLGFTLTVLFVFSITAYAAGPLISRLLHEDERLKHVDLALSQPFDISQTIENVTVTVHWAYADADYVLVGYTIQTSDGKRYDPNGEHLKDAAGVAFPWQGCYGVSGQSDILQVTLPPGEGTFVSIFDNVSSLNTLDVNFTVYTQELVFSSLPISSTSEAGVVQAHLEPMPAGKTIGPFIFEFNISVISSDHSG
jgi:hypothetical protein